jgi:predicted alpha/beta hydrolase
VDPTVETVPRPSGDTLAVHSYPDDGSGPMALILPAMGVPARYYRHFAAELHAAGFAVLALDLRGNGASTPRPSRKTRYGYADLVDDVAAVCTALTERRAGRPLLLIGHSLGGQIGLLHAANDPAGIAGVVLVAAGIPYWRAYPGRRRFGVLSMIQSIGSASAVLGVWPGWGFGGRQAGRVMTDWARTCRTGDYRGLPGADEALAGATVPVLAISIEGDGLVPAPVVDHYTGLLRAAPVERAHVTADDLGVASDHFTWTRVSAPIVARIAAFAPTGTDDRPSLAPRDSSRPPR